MNFIWACLAQDLTGSYTVIEMSVLIRSEIRFYKGAWRFRIWISEALSRDTTKLIEPICHFVNVLVVKQPNAYSA